MKSRRSLAHDAALDAAQMAETARAVVSLILGACNR